MRFNSPSVGPRAVGAPLGTPPPLAAGWLPSGVLAAGWLAAGALAAGLLGDGVAPLLHAPTTTAAAAIAVRILRCCIGVLLFSSPPPRGADQLPASATG
jgi:hypothetical protein